ncbi:MAG TPA: carboxypeptidase regulatory-like domain-containing protein [Terriglobales bacterium]|jgi:hypothetical protein|nr:carboxypeptidase regulatory-like domain-containing protein [Terriglobales bacterium]
MRCLRYSKCVLLTMLLTLNVAAQQITGSIRGTVSDSSGAVVQGATVSARQTETGLMRTVKSGHDGSYLLLELPVGHYALEVTAQGFQKYLREGISLNVNEAPTVPVRLAVGTGTEQVEVMSDAQLIQGTTSSLGMPVLERELLDLPLDGRNFSQLGLLQPGVVPLTAGLQEAGGSLRNGQAYAVNGQRPESNNFLIDGANNVNSVDAGFVLKPPIDAIAEFRILTHNANAEFGQNTGSTTNIVTRSGTNSFHGAAWEFLRNDAMDASDFSTHSVQQLKQNQFGGTFGGPIVKDRTFFFAYYEGFRNRQGKTVNPTVPSLLQRQGDFSDACPMSIGGFDPNSGICADPNPNDGHQLYQFDFSSGPPHPAPVPFNKLTTIDPIAGNVLNFYPLPNEGLHTFLATQSLSLSNDQFGLRLDQYLSPADSLNLRYMYSGGPTTDPLSTSGANVPGFPVGEEDRAQNFVAQETHVFSPSLVSVLRMSYLRNKFLFDQHINHQLPSSLGFQYEPQLPEAAGPPFIQIAGFASVGDPITGPRNTFQNTYDVSGSLSWIRNRHELKFGGGFRRDQINALQGIASNGFFVFAPFPSFVNGFASFLEGMPVVFLQGGGNFDRHIRGQALNFYGQDTFKVNSRVTVNLGLRYELPFPYTELHNLQNLFVPGAHSKVIPSAPRGLLYPGDPGVPSGLIPTQKTALAPRVGIAWDPTGETKWLVSAAYGIFYEPFYNGQGGPLQDPISAPPYLATPQASFPVNWAKPFGNSNPFDGSFSKPMTLLVVAPKLNLPYAQDWNLNVQRSFGNDWLFQIGYVGTTGTHLPRLIEGNPAIYDPGQSTEDNVIQRRLYSGCTLTQPTGCNYASIGEIASISGSNYHALETSLRKRFGQGISFLASYTYSKSIDDVSSFNITGSASQPVAGENDLAQNPADLGAERGRSMFDARHRLVLSYQWSVPFWRQAHTWYQHALGNWQFNGIVTAMSGTPFTVFDSTDVSLQGSAPEISGFSSNRPNLVGNPNSGPHTAQEWMNKAAFQRVTPDPNSPVQQFGNEGRNVVQGPGYANWDFSAVKNIRVMEGKELQFRGELFNFLNHTNLRLPNSDISSPTFGEIHSDLGPRVIQVALKFLF